ncbi:MAG: nitrogenase iron-molybdenum cofactor biosynthesis protein NifN [Magnetococcales bacterium]|nr:nitrogenase iron-molybdenum cofactor biosynthesis protein NifN [Magnetococcales bacterium]
MAKVTFSNKALVVRPLKASPPMGAVLVVLGLDRALPLLHGSQGCSAFTKVYFTRHFREPIAMQTTAMDQVTTVMGADANLIEALDTVLSKLHPEVVGVITTGLSETEGVDLQRVLREFRTAHPQWRQVPVVGVNAPDYGGSLETGYAAAVEALVTALVPEGRRGGGASRRLNVLAGPSLTPGDALVLHEVAEQFELQACLLPDLGGGLDGHLSPDGFSPLSGGGSRVAAWANAAEAALTLVVGRSLYKAADLLRERSGVADCRFEALTSLTAWDTLVMTLSRVSGRAVPQRLRRQREQYLDALLDSHFLLSGTPVALAGDPDWVKGICDLLGEVGAVPVAVVSTGNSPVFTGLPCEQVVVGDLQDLQRLAGQGGAEVLIGNSHVADLAAEMGLPVMRAGYPVHDALGVFRRAWIGYPAMGEALFELANRVHQGRPRGVAPHVSALSATAFA